MARIQSLFTQVRSSIAATIILMSIFVGFAKRSYAQDYVYATGNPKFTVQVPVELGFINVANGNLHIEIPIVSKSQRGKLQVNERLIYDSRIWHIVNSGGGSYWQPTNIPNDQRGWRFVAGHESGDVRYQTTYSYCPPSSYPYPQYSNFSWEDRGGTVRNFPTIQTAQTCVGTGTPNAQGYASDASGYYMSVTNYNSATVYAPDGTEVSPSVEDTNGNYFSAQTNGDLIDTTGVTPIQTSANGSNQNYYDVLTSQGNRQRITQTFNPVVISSAFNQAGVVEYPPTSLAITNSIQLPDGSTYLFGYDSYGEMNSITLPTGGQITFSYTNFTDAYGNVNRWVTSRTSASQTWNLTPLVVTTCPAGTQNCQQKATLGRPDGSSTVYNFTMNNGAWPFQIQTFDANLASL